MNQCISDESCWKFGQTCVQHIWQCRDTSFHQFAENAGLHMINVESNIPAVDCG